MKNSESMHISDVFTVYHIEIRLDNQIIAKLLGIDILTNF